MTHFTLLYLRQFWFCIWPVFPTFTLIFYFQSTLNRWLDFFLPVHSICPARTVSLSNVSWTKTKEEVEMATYRGTRRATLRKRTFSTWTTQPGTDRVGFTDHTNLFRRNQNENPVNFGLWLCRRTFQGQTGYLFTRTSELVIFLANPGIYSWKSVN